MVRPFPQEFRKPPACPQHGAGSFANADGIAGTIAPSAEYFISFYQQLVIRDKTCTDIDRINAVNYFFSSGNGLKVFAFGHHGAGNSRMVFVGNGFQQQYATG